MTNTTNKTALSRRTGENRNNTTQAMSIEFQSTRWCTGRTLRNSFAIKASQQSAAAASTSVH